MTAAEVTRGGAARGVLRHPAAAVVVSSLVAQLALLVSGPLVVRLLGVAGRGELALAWSVVLGAGQLVPLGLPVAIVWAASARGCDPADLVRRVAGGYAGQMALVAVPVALVVVWLSGGGWVRAVVAAAGVVAIMAAVLGLAGLQGAGRFHALAVLQVVPALLYSAAVVVLFALDTGSVTALLAISLAGWAFVAVVTLAMVLRPAGAGPDRGAPTDASTLRSYGRRAMLAGLAPIDTLGLEQVLLGLVVSSTALGLFVVGWAFETAPVLVLAALATVVGPRVGRLSATDPGAVRAFAVRWLLLGGALGALVCLTVQVVLAPVLVWAFGSDAAPAVPLARVLTVAGVVLGLRRVSAACLIALGRARVATTAELAGVAVMAVGMLAAGGRADTWPGWVLVVAGAVTLTAQLAVLLRRG